MPFRNPTLPVLLLLTSAAGIPAQTTPAAAPTQLTPMPEAASWQPPVQL